MAIVLFFIDIIRFIKMIVKYSIYRSVIGFQHMLKTNKHDHFYQYLMNF